MQVKFILVSFFLSVITLVSAQNVGIGTNNPQTKLDVAGAITHEEPSTPLAAVNGTNQLPSGYSQIRVTAGTGLNAAFTLTAPSSATTGQILVINNTTGYTATFGTATIAAGSALQFVYSNSAWVPTTAPANSGSYIQNQTSTTQTAGFNISGNALIGGSAGIGNTNPNASAILDLSNTSNLGLLLPNMNGDPTIPASGAGSIAAPGGGLMIYNKSSKCIDAYINGHWEPVYCSCPAITPFINSGYSTSICSGGNTNTFTIPYYSGAASYTWSVAPGSTGATPTSGTGTTFAVTNTTGPGTYTVSCTVANACGTNYTTTATGSYASVTVNATPTITSGGIATAVCTSTSSQTTVLPYTATTGSPISFSIAWASGISPQTSTSYAFSSGSGSMGPVNVPASLAAGTYTGTVTITTSSGCTNTQSISLTVNSSPTITSAGIAASVCSSASSQTTTLPYTATTASPTSFSIAWASGISAQTSTSYTFSSGSGNMGPVNIPAGLAVGTYTGTVTLTNASGCTATQSISVTVKATPTFSSATPSLCTGVTNSALTVSTATGGSFATGTGSATGATIVVNGSDPSYYMNAGTVAGTESFVYTASDGCTATLTMTVNAKPTISGNTGTINCYGTTLTLTGSVSGTSTWSSANTGVATVSGTTASGTVTAVSSGTSVITFTASNGCSNTTTVTVNVGQNVIDQYTSQNGSNSTGSATTIKTTGTATELFYYVGASNSSSTSYNTYPGTLTLTSGSGGNVSPTSAGTPYSACNGNCVQVDVYYATLQPGSTYTFGQYNGGASCWSYAAASIKNNAGCPLTTSNFHGGSSYGASATGSNATVSVTLGSAVPAGTLVVSGANDAVNSGSSVTWNTATGGLSANIVGSWSTDNCGTDYNITSIGNIQVSSSGVTPEIHQTVSSGYDPYIMWVNWVSTP